VRLSTIVVIGLGLSGAIAAANAAECPGNPGAMGTSRVLKINPREYPRIGTVQYQDTLPLADKEVVLTFDDGPMPPYTTRVLETLAHECVKANYFIVGRMARGYPELLRRIHAEGHVIGTHSENHPLAFERMPARSVQQEIEQGFASTAAALGSQGTVAPFFRIPGLLRAETVEAYLRSRAMVTWSADIVADDWKHIPANEVVNRALARLDARGKGILLLHDIQPATALAMPHLLRELKRRGYKIVQVAPASVQPLVASAPRQSVGQPAELAQRPLPAAAVRPPPVTPTVNRATPEPMLRAEPPPAAVMANAEPSQDVGQVHAAPIPADTRQAAATPPETPAAVERAMRLPIVEARPQPKPQAPTAQATRPLTPAFKPSHSASPPQKITELEPASEPKPPRTDPWAMRAEVEPAHSRPLAASSQ
jgi:peptidoglycan/xylan/chitin deacetylase (PgdA/CDA1 family)